MSQPLTPAAEPSPSAGPEERHPESAGLSIQLAANSLVQVVGCLTPGSNNAWTLTRTSEPLATLIAENRLGEVKGIGESIQKKIHELVTTGKLAYYEELKAATPPGLVAMLEIPGLGPKKIKVLHDELGIETIEQLEKACKEGRSQN